MGDDFLREITARQFGNAIRRSLRHTYTFPHPQQVVLSDSVSSFKQQEYFFRFYKQQFEGLSTKFEAPFNYRIYV